MNETRSSSSHPVLRRIPLLLGVLLFLLVAAGFLYQNIAEARDRRYNPMTGKLVEVEGRKMHINCTGAGDPTVILDAGLGDTFLSWRKVQPPIAKFTHVCSYDRAGLGYSESASGPRTSKIIAQQLHDLLLAANMVSPYVLVGHSMGGYDVRLYASLYPAHVAGIVLVDASHPDQEKRFPPELKNMQGSWEREAEFLEYTMPFGLPRLMGLCEDDPVLRAAECNWHHARESLAEMKAFSESASQTEAAGSLGNIPLAVLSHDPAKPSSELPPDLAQAVNQEWGKMQEEMSHLSSVGTHSIATGSAHYIQLDRPDVVIDAVRRVVEQVRNGRPVPAASNSASH